MTTLVLSMVLGPPGIERQTRFVSSGFFQIGRSSSCDWVIDDPNCLVSKRQCVFRQDDAGWSVADVSRNGSFVARGSDVRRLGAEPHRVSPGEKLCFGQCEIAIDFEEDEASFRKLAVDGSRQMPMSSPPNVPPIQTSGDWHREGPLPSSGLRRVWPHQTQSHADALKALLDGASLAHSDVEGQDGGADVLRRAGVALRTAIGEIRALRLLMLGEAGQRKVGSPSHSSKPLVEAVNERDALRWLLDPARSFDTPGDLAISAVFDEFRQHHESLVRAARQAMRAMFELLDPDEPERQMLPHWLDLVPGWRHARSAVLARRRYRRMSNILGKTVDQMLARAYWDVHREIDGRWRHR